MAAPCYQLVFDGKLADGFSRDEVHENLRRLFKLSETQADHLFQQGAVVVKRDLDAEMAARYQTAFLKAGALVELRGIAAPPPGQEAAKQQPSASRRGSPLDGSESPKTTLQQPNPLPGEPEPLVAKLAAPATNPGEDVTEPQQPTSATDTHAIGGAPPSNPSAPQRVEASAAAMRLLPPGALITDATEPEPAAPDTSHLSLIGGEDMTLSDCAPPDPEPPTLDLGRYDLEPVDTTRKTDPDRA